MSRLTPAATHSYCRRGNGARGSAHESWSSSFSLFTSEDTLKRELQRGCRWTWRALRSLHSALERLFSCVQFAMDNWGNWGCIFTAYFQLDLKFLHPDSPNIMNNALKSQILEIVTGVPSGCIFDSHFVIAALWEQPSDECLRYCVSFLQTKRANSELAKQIGRCTVDGRCIVEPVGKAWSNTIRHKPGECTCWRRL